MSALCVIAAGKTTIIAAASVFTLSWTHSAQMTEWRETWELSPAGLSILEARVKGSGAGMEPASDAKLRDGWWVWRPDMRPRRSVFLAASGATAGGWTLCADGGCVELGKAAGEPVKIRACDR